VAAVSGIRIEPAASDDELERSVEMQNAVHAPHRTSLAEQRESERQARGFAAFNAIVDGSVVGTAYVLLPSFADTPHADVCVLPASRNRGIGERLYQELSRWAEQRGASALRASVTEGKDESLAFAQRRGFVEVSRDLLAQLDLTAIEEPAVLPPPVVEIRNWFEHPELVRGIYEVACEAWPDIPNSDLEQIEPFDKWLSVHMQGFGDDPRCVFVAVAGHEVVGYAKLVLSDAEPEQGFHDLTGVKRAWRGRGIARALKQTQIAWAKREGLERLLTVNEQENEPIRRLNEHFGYRPIPGRIRLRGPVAGKRSRLEPDRPP
jgi:mycothiol synthase